MRDLASVHAVKRPSLRVYGLSHPHLAPAHPIQQVVKSRACRGHRHGAALLPPTARTGAAYAHALLARVAQPQPPRFGSSGSPSSSRSWRMQELGHVRPATPCGSTSRSWCGARASPARAAATEGASSAAANWRRHWRRHWRRATAARTWTEGANDMAHIQRLVELKYDLGLV